MDPPVIIHSPNCSCQYCSSELPSTHTCGSQDPIAQSHAGGIAARITGANSEYFSLSYVLLVAVVSVLLGFSACVYIKSVSNEDPADMTYYYQDLNSVEIKLGKNPLDPEVIKAIHSFQEYPFGYVPSIRGGPEHEVSNEGSGAVALTDSRNVRQVDDSPCAHSTLTSLWKDDLSFTIIAVTVLALGVVFAPR
ncbi:triple gene block protein 3 [Colombian potato soil-borne virus]|uniref:Triple gene block protein 3 n=1 Tax=Colombian potato soil-borne virus TaxID=1758139 RepID=A0A0U3C0J2_9VIRU|nr:triple gene block protein 3 [Colombian potato soil-borne virus]ALT22305.1 triple gene block protein 3 [Colombian potato soil-borne virus]ALT22312.1 triple gene block protein 3 [Colombian potato soil-borne virus]